ncbi:MAG TPA: AI-2E family transporter [Chthoniobacterales bacterium]|jgi:hypothetical protein|nr:AI-2E family transporter [Chthoniobacterales bacterium]
MYALLPPLAYVLCAMIEGNLATPLFLGRWLTLNRIAILLTFLLWSYLWGVAGILLAVPLLATFKNILRSNSATQTGGLISWATVGTVKAEVRRAVPFWSVREHFTLFDYLLELGPLTVE